MRLYKVKNKSILTFLLTFGPAFSPVHLLTVLPGLLNGMFPLQPISVSAKFLLLILNTAKVPAGAGLAKMNA